MCCQVLFVSLDSCVSFSVAVISSMGFGGGVVDMVQPIHAPMARIAMKAMSTGMAISQNCTSALAPRFSARFFYEFGFLVTSSYNIA
jgi:hypothetical protein